MKRTLAVVFAAIMLVTCFASCSGGKYAWMNYDYSKYIELCDYDNIKVDFKSDEIIKLLDDYNKSALDQAKLSKTEELKDKGNVQNGDTVKMDFVGRMNGKTFEGGSATDYELQIGSGQFIDGFEDGLIGAQIGKSVVLNLKFPDPYPNNPDFAGKDVEFTVTVKSITRVTYPDIDSDEIAKKLGATSLKEYQNTAVANAVSSYVMNYVVESSAIKRDLPKDAIETVIDEAIDYYNYMATQYQSTLEQMTGMSEKDLRATLKTDESTKERVKSYLVYYAICEAEGLYPEDYDKAVEDLAKSLGADVDDLTNNYPAHQIESEIVCNAVSDFLSDHYVSVNS